MENYISYYSLNPFQIRALVGTKQHSYISGREVCLNPFQIRALVGTTDITKVKQP